MPRQRRSRGEPVLWPGLGMQVALSSLCAYLHSTFPRLNERTLGEETTLQSQPCLPAVQCAVSSMQLTVQTGHRRMVEPSASVPTITISFSWQQSEEYGTSQPTGQPSRPRRGLGIGGRRPSLECSSERGKSWCAQPRGGAAQRSLVSAAAFGHLRPTRSLRIHPCVQSWSCKPWMRQP